MNYSSLSWFRISSLSPFSVLLSSLYEFLIIIIIMVIIMVISIYIVIIITTIISSNIFVNIIITAVIIVFTVSRKINFYIIQVALATLTYLVWSDRLAIIGKFVCFFSVFFIFCFLFVYYLQVFQSFYKPQKEDWQGGSLQPQTFLQH